MFKKIILAACVIASAAFAQISVGGHAAANMSSMWGDNADNIASSFGFAAGVEAKITLPALPLAVVPGVMIDMRNSCGDDDDKATMTTWALDIPVMVRFSIIPAFYVQAGPTLGFLLSHSEAYDGEDVPDEFVPETNTFEFGLAFGVGTSILPMLDIDFRVNMGLTNVFEEVDYGFGTEEIDAKNLQFALGVTYWFM
ncbi:MAG: PorT family protein [Fibrobacter sp.]|nr:PorT family protein [Fibrobacter sp.]